MYPISLVIVPPVVPTSMGTSSPKNFSSGVDISSSVIELAIQKVHLMSTYKLDKQVLINLGRNNMTYGKGFDIKYFST